jgi:hypothetical protein
MSELVKDICENSSQEQPVSSDKEASMDLDNEIEKIEQSINKSVRKQTS